MKTREFVCLMLISLLFTSCSAFGREKFSCVRGEVLYVNVNDATKLYGFDLVTGKHKILYENTLLTIGTSQWSQDGKAIVFVGYKDNESNLYIFNLDDDSIKQITDITGVELNPTWSSDDRFIIATSMIDGVSQIVKIDLDDLSLSQLTYDANNHTQPSLFTDNKKLAYASNENGQTQIFILDINTGRSEILDEELFGFYPKWSPDGRYISFTTNSFSERSSINRVALYDIETNATTLLVPENNNDGREKEYSLSNAIWSKDGKCVMYIKSAKDSNTLVVMNILTKETTEIKSLGLLSVVDWYSN